MSDTSYREDWDGYVYAIDASWVKNAERPIGELVSKEPIPNAVQITDGKRFYRLFGYVPNPNKRPSPEETKRLDEARARDAEELFRRLHFIDEPTFDIAGKYQDWKCAQCSVVLNGAYGASVVHFHDGKLLCGQCSLLRHMPFGR